MDEPDAAAISFGTDGWRATLSTFTESRVQMVGQAVATYLDDEGIEGPVAVGFDARETSPGFAEALADVLAANGRDVVVPPGDLPTPVLAWTVATGDFAGGLMITASHNPPEYNGVKFVPADGAPALPDVTDAIEARLAAPTETAGGSGEVTERDLVVDYLDHALATGAAALEGLTVAYDAMHGSGRGVTDRLLEAAGADVRRIRCEPDPEFGGTAPEPEPDRVEALVDAVTGGEADLGLVNDGDADRLGVVTPRRGYLDPNHFLAAIYEFLLANREKGDVVRTVSTSSLVDQVAAAHGQAVHETAVGFKWVAAAMADHDALLGGEESGGFGLGSHLRNKDGVLFALLAASAEADQPFDERVDALTATHGEIHQDRVSVDCPDERKGPVLDELADALPETVAGVAVDRVNDVDGFKIILEDGTWLLVRPSGTEPKMRIYAEAWSGDRLDDLLEAGDELVTPLI
jgi:phosphomannomutase